MGLISGFQKRRLEQRLQQTPDDAELYERLAALHHKDGDSAAALRVLAAGLTRPLPPQAAQRLLSELDLGSRAGRFDLEPAALELRARVQDSAVPHKAELLARFEALLLRCASLSPAAAAGRRQALVRHAEEAAQSGRPWARLLLARGLLAEDAAQSAVEAAASALEGLAPGGEDPIFDGELALCRGDLLAASGKAAEAEAAYQEAGRAFQDPLGLAEARLRLGRLARDAGQTETAVERFNSALDYLGTRPEAVWVHAELARLYARQGRLDEARGRILHALQGPALGPAEKVDLLLLEAELLALERQGAEALATARRALDLAGGGAARARSLRGLADLLAATPEGQQEAAEHYRTLLEIGSAEDGPVLRFKLGRVLLADRRAAEALDVIEPLVLGQELPGASAVEVGLLRAEAHIAAAEHGAALDLLAELKRLAPQAEEAVEERARRFRRELASGELPGLISPALRAELEAKLSALAGEAALLERMRMRLARSRESLVGRLEQVISGRGQVDEEMLDQIEELLITADVGVQTSMAMLEKLRKQRLQSPEELKDALRGLMLEILRQSCGRLELRPEPPTVILMAGVNGAGKTTTIAKLAYRFREEGKSVLLVAGDTFRAGAIEQLQVWADRLGVPLIRQQEGSDPSAVAFDGAQAARARKADVVIIDTAGRLQTKVNLMEELKKIVRVLGRQIEGAPHEVLLVLDGTAGQNALSQARLFSEAAAVTGLVLTKLDGTAKGGIILSIANEMRLPIQFIGIGERMTDLREFDPELFVEALFGQRTAAEVSKKASREA